MDQPAHINGEDFSRHEGRILFIVEARNGAERATLNKRLKKRIKSGSAADRCDKVYLSVSDTKSASQLQKLADKLESLPADSLLVPVRMAWKIPGFRSDKMVKLRQFLLGDPRQPGPLRSRLILMRDAKRAQMLHGKPATLATLQKRYDEPNVPGHDEPNGFARFVARLAGLALDIEERGFQGSRYKVPRYVGQALRSDPKFLGELKDISRQSGEPVSGLLQKSRKYMKELIARPSPLFIDLRMRMDQSTFSKGFEDEVRYSEGSIDRLRSIMSDYPTLLLFTHKTYIDGATPSKMLYDNDLPMAHVFGGINMALPVLGSFLRRTGMIFIRRSFSDNLLYKAILRHYIGYLLAKRFPMTWAFEGTRSRLGKLMPPRYGLLKYVLDSAHDMDIGDIHIVPMVTSFDLIRDVRGYADEQAGKRKKSESLGWLIGYLRSMREPMGRIYIDLADPVVVNKAPKPGDKLALSKIAFQVAVEANRATPLTLTSLMCFILLGWAPRGMTTGELRTMMGMLVLWAMERDIRLTEDLKAGPDENVVPKTLEILKKHGLIMEYDQARENVYVIEPQKHPIASYYRNSIVHHFLNKATIELALLKALEQPEKPATDIFWQETLRLRDLFKFEFFYSPKQKYRRELEAELARTDGDWENKLGGTASDRESLLSSFRPVIPHAVFLQFVEAYSVVFEIIERLDENESIEKDECVKQALTEGRQDYLLRRISSEASIAKTLFENAHDLAGNLGLLDEKSNNVSAKRKALFDEFGALSVRMDKARAATIADAERLLQNKGATQ